MTAATRPLRIPAQDVPGLSVFLPMAEASLTVSCAPLRQGAQRCGDAQAGDLRPFGPGPPVLPAQAWPPLPSRGRPVVGPPARDPRPSWILLSEEDQAMPQPFLPQQESKRAPHPA